MKLGENQPSNWLRRFRLPRTARPPAAMRALPSSTGMLVLEPVTARAGAAFLAVEAAAAVGNELPKPKLLPDAAG